MTIRSRRGWTGSVVLLGTIAMSAGLLAAWKSKEIREADAAAASQPEPMESVTAATAREHQHRETTTSIGTVSHHV